MAVVSESKLLKPRLKDIDENSWECFNLRNVEVRDNSGKGMANLLLADAHWPMRISGKLGQLPKHQLSSLLRKPLDKSLTLEIEAVARYAYGQYDDGSIALWALGKAGWFELEPSRKYRPIFDGMIEAVVLLYYIADYYKRKLARRSPHAEKIDDFFAKYAKDHPTVCESREQAAQMVYKHTDFLLMTMIKGNEGVQWPKTALLEHLKQRFPTSINDVHTRMNGTKRKRKDKVGDRIMEEPGSQSSNQDTRKSSVDGLPQKRNSEDCDSAGSENISVKKSRRRSVLVNTDCDMHGADILQTPSNSEGELEVARRGGKGTAHEEPKGKGKGKGKKREGEGQKGKSTSTLRPKSTRPTRLASKSAASELLDEDDNTDDVDDNYIPDEAAFDPFRRRNHKGKNAGRSSGKKAGANSFFAEGPESAQDLPDGSDELPLRLKPPPNMNPTEYTSPPPIFEIAIPQSEANRPGDVWQCTFDGCCHEVYGATTDIGGVLIKEHYRNHYFEKQTQLDLVMKEERPHFPVHNLLKRIREFTEKDLGSSTNEQTHEPFHSPTINSAHAAETIRHPQSFPPNVILHASDYGSENTLSRRKDSAHRTSI